MKDISGAMNQTGAINGWLYPSSNGNKHKLVPRSQCHTASQTGTNMAALLVHHLHFMSTSVLKEKWCSTAVGSVIVKFIDLPKKVIEPNKGYTNKYVLYW